MQSIFISKRRNAQKIRRIRKYFDEKHNETEQEDYKIFVKDKEKLEKVIQKITECKNKKNKVVVVVSAQGDTTDNLIQQENEITLEFKGSKGNKNFTNSKKLAYN